MNRLPVERRALIVSLLTEGNRLRATSRIAGISINTVTKLLVDVGEACANYQSRTLRNLEIKRVECDEIWAFCYAKQKNVPEDFKDTPGYGVVWTWVAIDADTKLVPSWLVGARTTQDCYAFLADLRDRMPPGNRIQLSTDGFGSYPVVVDALWRDGIDYAQIIKDYTEAAAEERHKYSPVKCKVVDVNVLSGEPDPMLISTSHVERNNLTMRMGMRRFTRLTNGFSKKIVNHAHAVSLHFMAYNFVRPHKTLKQPYHQTPAIAAGIADHIWTPAEIAQLSN